jgi:hypothetical protein
MRGTSATPSTSMTRAAQAPGTRPHSGPAVARSGVFIAYSHLDRDLLGELQVHLKPLQKAWMLDLWDDLRVDAGPRGAEELQRAVEATRVAVLLVSPNFLSSAFVVEHGLLAMLAGQEHPRAAVMCVYLRPAMDVFAESRFVDPSTGMERSVQSTSFRGLNDPMNPLSALERPARHEVLQAAAGEIIKAAHRGLPVVTQ